MEAVSPDPRLFGRPDEDVDARLYRRMRFIRRFEEKLLLLFEEGILAGTTHCSIGQEADAVAVMAHVRPGDHTFSNHRCHGHYLARTGDALGLYAEIMGKDAGVCRGIGGSQHICAPGFKSNGIQGGIVPTAAGIAWAQKLAGGDDISVVFIGDGTLGEGAVYETLNIAQLWSLPLWIVLEDNGWSQSTPLAANFAGDMRMRFEAFGLPVSEIDSTDVKAIETVVAADADHVRTTRTPHVTILHTYRLCNHSKSSDARPEDEVKARWATEPLVVHGPRLQDSLRDTIDADVEAALDEVIAHARSLP
ncbi:MAG: thiamine pyrophosphate-dependent dehydrogenase E1 component subunit alpha [Deltaproteobacteria bacterium]|jgi:TPP-dependent pyruvate/acetoin dehydrogenase alpha subunit